MAASSGTRHFELHALYQGFCYLRTSSPPSSSPPPPASWLKRYAVILESGLVFFDIPAAGRGAPVDKIRARDMQGARLVPHDPKGCTLEIFLLAPHSTLQVHLGSTSVTEHWLHLLLYVLIPQVIQRPKTFMKRSYLHIHILECWLNEGAIDETFQDGAQSSVSYFNVVASLYHGGEKLAQSHELSTTFVLGCTNLRWNELLTFPILLYDLPQEVRLNLALYHGKLFGTNKVESKMIGWSNFCFIHENGSFKSKKHNLKLWKDPPYYSCGTFSENTTDNFCGVLSVALDHGPYLISLQQREDINNDANHTDDENEPPSPTDEEVELLDTIISTSDVITPPTEAQKHVLWQLRHALVERSHALPKFLMSVPWNKHKCVLEVHRIITRWKPLPPFYALQLLGPQFGDKAVRDYAVERLRNLTEEEFQLVLIQLVQALVYEPYNNSSLLQLLLERAINWTIGHHFFWLVKKHGGGAKAVFRVETLQNWLVSNNRTGEDYNNAVDNFVRSCAAYCVATCVLGIGDRHNDNVMIKRTGEFFHIDFGHILGHFKSKFGIKRERARFVFTPDMAYVMGGIGDERFKHFQELCGLAFNKLRENAHLFLNLTHLMVSSGIPEIATPQNVYYLRDILVLGLSEEDAKFKFNEWIIESLQTTATQVNYAIHTWAHG